MRLRRSLVRSLENLNLSMSNDKLMNTEGLDVINSILIVASSNESVIGKSFCSYDDAKQIYFEYSTKLGFFVRMVTTKVVNGRMSLRHFVCGQEGYSHSSACRINDMKKKAKLIREIRRECEAFHCINRVVKIDEWVVGAFNNNHNHSVVTPTK